MCDLSAAELAGLYDTLLSCLTTQSFVHLSHREISMYGDVLFYNFLFHLVNFAGDTKRFPVDFGQEGLHTGCGGHTRWVASMLVELHKGLAIL